MYISKKSLFLLMVCMFFPVLVSENAFTSIITIPKFYDIIYYSLPILYFSFFTNDIIKNKVKIKFDKFTFIILLLAIALAISIPLGISIGFNSISNLIYFIFILGYIYTIHFYNFEKNDIDIIIRVSLIIFTLVVLFGIIQYVFNINLITAGIYKYPPAKGRIYSTMITSTHLDKYITVNLLILLYISLKNNRNLMTIYISWLLGAVALALTFSRTGILAYYIISMIFAIIFICKKKYINLLILAISILMMCIMPGQKYIINSTIEYANIKIDSALTAIKLDPLIKVNDKIFNFFIIKDNINNNSSSNSNSKNNNNSSNNSNSKNNNTTSNNNSSNNSNSKNNNNSSNNDASKTTNENSTILNTDASIESREIYDSIANQLIRKHPISGIGIGNYLSIINRQNFSDYINMKLNPKQRYLYSHNMFRYLTVETGFMGLLPFISMLILLFIKMFNKKHNLISGLSIFLFILFCFFEPLIYMRDFAPFFIIILVLLTKNYEFKNNS